MYNRILKRSAGSTVRKIYFIIFPVRSDICPLNFILFIKILQLNTQHLPSMLYQNKHYAFILYKKFSCTLYKSLETGRRVWGII